MITRGVRVKLAFIGRGALSNITLSKPNFSAPPPPPPPTLINIAQSLITICLPNSLLASSSWKKKKAARNFSSMQIFFTSIGQAHRFKTIADDVD